MQDKKNQRVVNNPVSALPGGRLKELAWQKNYIMLLLQNRKDTIFSTYVKTLQDRLIMG